MDTNTIKRFKVLYPKKGKKWCMKHFNLTEASVRNLAYRNSLKQDRNSKFFKEWQEKARVSKIGKKRPEHSKFLKEYIKEHPEWTKWDKKRKDAQGVISKERIEINGHPRGMLGKNHSQKTRELFSNQRKGKKLNISEEGRQKLSDSASKMMHNRIANKGTVYSRSKNGWYIINGKRHYFRSSWEVNYARYLEFLLSKNDILSWEYEPDTFWFEKIKRGVRSYLPDFKVFQKNGGVEYHEVKGWMDPKSITKLKRMKLYYPDVTMVVIDSYAYRNILNFERMFPEAIKE